MTIINVLAASLFLVFPLSSFYTAFQTFEMMDQLFDEMTERTRAHKMETRDYNVSMKRNADVIEISLVVPTYVTARDISVQTEAGALYVVIAAQGDRVELAIEDQMMGISVHQSGTREEKDDQGVVRVIALGSSAMIQQISLPAKIDLQSVKPTADVSNGILTITLGVKGITKIPVTTLGGSVCCGDRPNNLPVNEINGEVGRDVFKENFEK